MGKPHKHAELIKAWADGAEIQCFSEEIDDWLDISEAPRWWPTRQYRIKPEPKPDVVLYMSINDSDDYFFTTSEKYDFDNLKLTFDGETGKLKSAEVLS